MQSLIVAFAMYSKIPMPVVEWNDRNMRYAFAWFPLIGIVIGFAELLACELLEAAGAGELLKGALLTVIPLLVTGGIHMDGFMDTGDALSSYADREKRLEILKDSHVGAFAVIRLGIYLILTVGLWSEINEEGVIMMIPAFALERALSGFAAVRFKNAREKGMLADFEKRAAKKKVAVILAAEAAVFTAVMIFLNPAGGITAAAAAFLMFGYYKRMSSRIFGGITGDLAGWFLQMCEIAMLAAVILIRFITGGIAL